MKEKDVLKQIKDQKMAEYVLECIQKAKKWDELGKKIESYYVGAENGDEGDGLHCIGEDAATAYGWLVENKCKTCSNPTNNHNDECVECTLRAVCDITNDDGVKIFDDPSVPFVTQNSIGINGDKFSVEDRKLINDAAEKMSDALIGNIKKQFDAMKGKCKKCKKDIDDSDITFCDDCAVDEIVEKVSNIIPEDAVIKYGKNDEVVGIEIEKKGMCENCKKETEDIGIRFCDDCAVEEIWKSCERRYGRGNKQEEIRLSLPKFELNKTYFGDCLQIMDIIPDKSVNMIMADLPYETTSRNDWDKRIDINRLWQHYRRIIKDDGNIVLTAINPFTAELIISNIEMFKYSLVWEKTTATQFLNAKKRFLQSHEDILVFSPGKLGKITYNPQKTTGHVRKVSSAHHKRNSKKSTNYGDCEPSSYDSTERYPKSVLKFATDKQKSALHMTQKPVALIRNLVLTFSNPGDTVLDNVSGSGTTGLVCKENNRNYIMIEKTEEFYNISKQRVGEI